MDYSSPRAFPWWTWISLTSVGLGLGLPLGFALGVPVELLLGMMLVVPAIGFVAGASLGASQSVVLANRQVHRLSWTGVTALGMAVGLTAGTVGIEIFGFRRGELIDEALSMVLLGLAVGVSVGSAQAFLLRGRDGLAQQWVAVSTLGTGMAFLTGGVLAEWLVGTFRSPAGLLVFAFVAGLMMALATAPSLKRMPPPAVSAT